MRLRMLARGVIAAECAWQPYAARKTSVPEAAHKRNVGGMARSPATEIQRQQGPGGRPGSRDVELFGRRVVGGAVVAPYFRVSAPARESTFLPSVLLRAPWHALPLFCRSAHPSGASSSAATTFERAPADSTTSAHFFGLHRVYAPRGLPRKVFRVQIPRH